MVRNVKAFRNNRRAARSELFDPDNYDYRPRPGSAAIGRGVDAGSPYGFVLRPGAEYQHPAQMRARRTAGALDLGALEYRQ